MCDINVGVKQRRTLRGKGGGGQGMACAQCSQCTCMAVSFCNGTMYDEYAQRVVLFFVFCSLT